MYRYYDELRCDLQLKPLRALDVHCLSAAVFAVAGRARATSLHQTLGKLLVELSRL
jgi:hypothetical protein